MTATTIPTRANLIVAIMGKVRHGHAELVHLLAACADYGYNYPHCEHVVPPLLSELVAAGKLECVEVQSPFAKSTYRTFRLPASAPLDASAPRTGAGTVRDGFISPEQFRAQAQRKRK